MIAHTPLSSLRSGALAAAIAIALVVSPAPPAHAAESRAFVVTTDFQTGGLSWADLATRAVTRDVASVYSDARARWAFGLLYVLNRLGQDNLQVIDPDHGYVTLHEFSLGNGSNPSDLAVVSPTRAYVALYGRAQIAIVNPENGASLGAIDLSRLADADGIPEADHMARFGRWILVSLQRLDEAHGFVPADTSLVAVIDAAADTLVDVDPSRPGLQAIPLSRANPVTAFAWDPVGRRFYLGCAGRYGLLDGGIVAIDPATFREAGVAATESQLAGDISDVEWGSAHHSYAIVTDASFNASLVAWDPATGARTATVFGPTAGLADCGLDDRGELYLCDNSFSNPGLRVFSTPADAPLAGPLDTGLPPYQVLFDAPTADVLGVPAATALQVGLGAPEPNPAREFVSFTLALARDGAVTVDAYDLAGRRVRSLAHGTMAAGTWPLRWDLRDERGGRVKPGTYFVRARANQVESVVRITIIE